MSVDGTKPSKDQRDRRSFMRRLYCFASRVPAGERIRVSWDKVEPIQNEENHAYCHHREHSDHNDPIGPMNVGRPALFFLETHHNALHHSTLAGL